jgi:inner membrane protein
MGRRTAVWKAALAGAVAGTLPDLDVLIDFGDPIRDMVLHRAETHALFWLTLFSLPFALLVARLGAARAGPPPARAAPGDGPIWRRWWLAMGLVLVTHPLLDAMTVYGTRLGLPFTDHPYGVGSIFIIDPLYTLPLLAGAIWALAARGRSSGRAANVAGLVLSTAYLGWSVAAQAHVATVARESLAAQGIAAERVLVTPTAFNTVLWRIVAVDGEHYHEGFRSLLDDAPRIDFDRFDRGTALGAGLGEVEGLRLLAFFSKGFYKLDERDGQIRVSDLRMGQEPFYFFSFVIAERASDPVPLPVTRRVGARPDLDRALPWLWRRALGEPLPPPR